MIWDKTNLFPDIQCAGRWRGGTLFARTATKVLKAAEREEPAAAEVAPARVVAFGVEQAGREEMQDKERSHAAEERAPRQALVPEGRALFQGKQHTA